MEDIVESVERGDWISGVPFHCWSCREYRVPGVFSKFDWLGFGRMERSEERRVLLVLFPKLGDSGEGRWKTEEERGTTKGYTGTYLPTRRIKVP